MIDSVFDGLVTNNEVEGTDQLRVWVSLWSEHTLWAPVNLQHRTYRQHTGVISCKCTVTSKHSVWAGSEQDVNTLGVNVVLIVSHYSAIITLNHSLLSGVRYTLVISCTLYHSDNSDVPISLGGPELCDTLSGDTLLCGLTDTAAILSGDTILLRGWYKPWDVASIKSFVAYETPMKHEWNAFIQQ